MFKMGKKEQSPEKPVELVIEKGEIKKVEPEVQAQPEPKAQPKKVDLNKPSVKEAIAQGKAIIKEGKSKADAARAIYALLKSEDKDVIVAAFVAGATLTEKGALTYWYNCKRKAEKADKKTAP
jgi:hypothetical protein